MPTSFWLLLILLADFVLLYVIATRIEHHRQAHHRRLPVRLVKCSVIRPLQDNAKEHDEIWGSPRSRQSN